MHSGTRLFITADGSHSVATGDGSLTYHSKHGAIQESQHVFIDAALHYKALQTQALWVLEIGFGTGLNAFMTFLEAEKKSLQIAYTTYELFPLPVAQAQELNYPKTLAAAEFQAIFQQMHHCSWEAPHALSPTFQFQKYQQSFLTIEALAQFDIIYFDVFAPEAQPDLWDEVLLGKMYRALKPGGLMTTYCAKGVVKRRLKAVGFTVESIPGPPGKREMTRALKPA